MGTTSCFVPSIADHRADDDRVAACLGALPGYLHVHDVDLFDIGPVAADIGRTQLNTDTHEYTWLH